MRKNVRVKTAVLIILVMLVLSACGGNDKVDTLPLPTAMAETENEVLETVVAETTTGEEIVGTEESVTEVEETTQDMTETESETPITETQGEIVTDADSAVVSDNAQPENPKESDVEPTETKEVKQEEPKVVHTHSYAGNITVSSGCETTGVMTYTCSCGDTYAESVPATGHVWTTTTETVYHPSLGHMERTEKRIVTIQCGCGFTTQDNDELDRHCIAEGHEDYPCGSITKTTYEDNWVVTQEAWEEVVTKNVCAVCGAVQ